MHKLLLKLKSVSTLYIFLISLFLGSWAGLSYPPYWSVSEYKIELAESSDNRRFYIKGDAKVFVDKVFDYNSSPLSKDRTLARTFTLDNESVIVKKEVFFETGTVEEYYLVEASKHYGWWSLLPALTAVILCLLTYQPLVSLFGGIVVGAALLGKYDLTGDVLIPSVATTSAAGILVLYLWLLGGLLGVWSKSGATQAFASSVTKYLVRGPKSAKFTAWLLGILFFQGGSISTVLVGTTVRPIADEQNVSHEEMSYIVDSTASPIASLLAFNAWPAYIQALIFVPGVAFLATESDRVEFFFYAIPFSFFAILSVFFTLLLSQDITWFVGRSMKKALKRSRETGQLDSPTAKPMVNLASSDNYGVAEDYSSSALEFVFPLVIIILVAVGTFILFGVPKVHWAFGMALLFACAVSLFKRMSLDDLVEGIGNGLNGVVLASVVLLLAITVGEISKETGGGLFLVNLLGESTPYWVLPITIQLITMVIAFSTGTSWGTYAIVFPLAMPLAWSVAEAYGYSSPEIFMAICFATVLNGSVYGDQCSPVSDTTVISSMTTGCDLIDHVKTQFFPATLAALLSGALWTLCAVVFS